jgi:hypothetical protein
LFDVVFCLLVHHPARVCVVCVGVCVCVCVCRTILSQPSIG